MSNALRPRTAAPMLKPLDPVDPRHAMTPADLLSAGRNSFPIVARSTRRSDGPGLAIGGTIALMLGGLTFWSMSGHRTAPGAPPVPKQVEVAQPTPKAIGPMPAPPAPEQAAEPGAASAPAPDEGDRLHAPTMVFDASETDVQASAPTSTAAATTSNPSPAGLSDNEMFAGRLGESQADTASVTAMARPSTTVSQGTLIPAVLETGINTDLPGYVRALVTQDIRSFDGSHILVPRSSRLIGQYKSSPATGQTRVYVIWTRLIRPDGASVALASPAIAPDGASGLVGEVNGHFMKRFGSAILLSVVGGLSAVGDPAVVVSGGQSAAAVAAQRDVQIAPTVRVRPGQPIRVFTARDLDFTGVVP